MRRVQKNILGLSGLAIVTAMTAIAVAVPGPEALAVSTTVTDTISVRVIDYMPSVDVTSTAGASVARPTYSFTVDYGHANKLAIKLTYTKNDVSQTVTLENIQGMGDETGSRDFSVNVADVVFPDGTRGGYGNYTVTVRVVAEDGTPIENYLSFNYTPVIGTNNGDDVIIDSMGDDVEKIEIRTKAGRVVSSATRQQVIANGMRIRLNLDDTGCQEQLYLYAYANGELLSADPFMMTTECLPVPDAGSPDTGGLFQNLNISKEDYLVTGLIVFFVLGIVGFSIVARGKKNHARKRR